MARMYSAFVLLSLAATACSDSPTRDIVTAAKKYTVTAGTTYEASADLIVHHSGNTDIAIQWYDSNQTIVGQSTGSTCTVGHCRSTLIAVAPSGATTATILVLTTGRQ